MIELRDLRKSYTTGSFVQKALDGVSLTFRDNEFVAILGPSGSGKTTLLNVLGGLDHADTGDIVINGTSTKNYKSGDWDTYRNHRIGFIFQSYNLIPHQTVLSNVELALTLAGTSRAERKERALEALARVGLEEHANKKPGQLSGGQMQRVAIARALVNNPDIVLADEPTGALDTETGVQVMNLLQEIANDRLVIMVTHNPELAERYATRTVRLADGKIIDDSNPFDAGVAQEAASSDALGTSAAAAGVAAAAAAGAAAAAPEEAQAASTPFKKADDKQGRRAHMGFLTALGLSFNNLMTKKGRTFMTAFAGSIGIIGIAAILSLSNGVNNYIADTEEEALTSYPLTITKSSFDISGLLASRMGGSTDGEEAEEENKVEKGLRGMSGQDEAKVVRTSGPIDEVPIMTDMFAQVKNNNLKQFKAFLDSDESGIEPYVHTVQYSYGIMPNVYMTDTSNGVKQLNPSTMGNTLTGGVDASAFGMTGSGTEIFNEMLDNRELLEDYMTVVAGRWPEKYDECLLVLSSTGRLTDYALYSLGYYDPDVMDQMTKDILEGKEVNVPETAQDFTIEKALEMEFSVVPSSDLYQYNDSQGIWTDISNDQEIMKQKVADGMRLKVVGVVQPSPDANSIALQQGIAYTPELIDHLMEQAASSDIAQAQKRSRDVDVFTGKTFDELQEEQGNDFDLGSMFTVDEQALKDAFSMDTSAFDLGSLDANSLGLNSLNANSLGIDPNKMSLDASSLGSLFDESSMRKILSGAPQFDAQSSGLAQSTSQLTEQQQKQISQATDALSADFLAWAVANNKLTPAGMAQAASGASASQARSQAEAASAEARDAAAAAAQAVANAQKAVDSATTDEGRAQAQAQLEAAQKAAAQAAANQQTAERAASQASDPQTASYSALFQEYLQTESAQKIVQPLQQELGNQVETAINASMQTYMSQQFIPYFSNAMQQMMAQAAQAMGLQMAQAMQNQMASVTQNVGSQLSSAISGKLSGQMSQLQNAMQNGFSFDANKFSNAISFNMTQDDLAGLLMNYLNADELSYDGNMKKLGYAESDSPESVSIYPVDFESKEKVLGIIDGYNERMRANGEEEQAIQYSDIAGVLMSSVTSIVDTISLVLIAFVSISLVVSSIMIGIITYISVLERKKEIGILRAMGASKRNIANVFNAETFIEGLTSGILAIAVVLALSVPVNAFIEAGWEVPNIMSLPWTSALALIGVSIVLTFIAGLIPSQNASRRDPVEALRSE